MSSRNDASQGLGAQIFPGVTGSCIDYKRGRHPRKSSSCSAYVVQRPNRGIIFEEPECHSL